MTQKSDWKFYALPPMTLVERSMINPESLTTDEYQQVMGFSAVYNCAQDYFDL
jgi:hypothetical protein